MRRQIIPPTRGAGGIFDSVGKLTPFFTWVEYLGTAVPSYSSAIIFWCTRPYQKEVGHVYSYQERTCTKGETVKIEHEIGHLEKRLE